MTEDAPALRHEAGSKTGKFFRPIKLSYEGNEVLSCSDDVIEIFEIPSNLEEKLLRNKGGYKEKESVYDYY